MWSFSMFTLSEDKTSKDLGVCYCGRCWCIQGDAVSFYSLLSCYLNCTKVFSCLTVESTAWNCPQNALIFVSTAAYGKQNFPPFCLSALKIFWHLLCSLTLIFVIFAHKETGTEVLCSFDMVGEGEESEDLVRLEQAKQITRKSSTGVWCGLRPSHRRR